MSNILDPQEKFVEFMEFVAWFFCHEFHEFHETERLTQAELRAYARHLARERECMSLNSLDD